MRVLALDTTTVDGSLAVVDHDRVIVARRGARVPSHAERLPGDLVDALDEAGMTTRDVDLFAVVAGPGSFTGLRIGIAAIQGLALVHGRRVVALSALEVLGIAAALEAAPGAIVAAWMDGYRREVFSTLYRVNEAALFAPDRLTAVEEARAGAPRDTLDRWLAAGTAPSTIAGNGATLYSEVIGTAARIVPHPELATLTAHMAIARAALGQTLPPAGVQPVYVRRPDVETARDARLAAEAAGSTSSMP
jgi:tRNA threonylcarbamoyladenosine biosynthesis protein TsaB